MLTVFADLLVSHDRSLIDRLATDIWEIHGNKLDVFRGTYREFVLRRSVVTSSVQPRSHILLPPKPLVRDNSKKTRQRVQPLALFEERIRQHGAAIQRLSRELPRAGEAQSFEKVHRLSWQIAQSQAALDALMAEWEKVAT
ncbi:MAG: hypothetical protein IMZ62_15195 [Chloroflexi bacterium]|nr:hypothetical protein [Chloroflexota bacterium]